MVFTRALLLAGLDVAQRFAALRREGGRPRRTRAGAWTRPSPCSSRIPSAPVRRRPTPISSIAWWRSAPVRDNRRCRPPAGAGSPRSSRRPNGRRRGQRDRSASKVVPPAATWFTREALAFAKRRPDDPRAPEFLARAVRATREGCADAETRSLSKAAFEHLHRALPEVAIREADEVLVRGARVVAAVIIGAVLPALSRLSRLSRDRALPVDAAADDRRRGAPAGRPRAGEEAAPRDLAPADGRRDPRAPRRGLRHDGVEERGRRDHRDVSRALGLQGSARVVLEGRRPRRPGVSRGLEGRARRRAHPRRAARPGAALQARDPHARRAGGRRSSCLRPRPRAARSS